MVTSSMTSFIASTMVRLCISNCSTSLVSVPSWAVLMRFSCACSTKHSPGENALNMASSVFISLATSLMGNSSFIVVGCDLCVCGRDRLRVLF